MTQTASYNDPYLLPHHRALLEASAINFELVVARGYRSVTDPMELHPLGFAEYQCRVPGLLLPAWTVTGEIGGHYLRPDKPRADNKDRVIKYEWPVDAPMRIDVPPAVFPRVGDPRMALGVTEGIRKSDSAVSHGLDCISIGGVWNWRGRNASGGLTALADWESIALNGRLIYLIFDSDVLTKAGVYLALRRLKAFLGSRRAKVRICHIPPTADCTDD